jgi:small subunit ribosomal protein S7
MSRRKKTYKREVIPDPVFKDLVIAKFINKMMVRGQKATAQRLLYGALDELKGKVTGEEPVGVFRKAIENIKPSIEVRSRRVGGATYQVPVDVRPSRRLSLAMRWLVNTRELVERKITQSDLLVSFLMLLIIVEMQLRKRKMFIEWQRQIKLFLITTGN